MDRYRGNFHHGVGGVLLHCLVEGPIRTTWRKQLSLKKHRHHRHSRTEENRLDNFLKSRAHACSADRNLFYSAGISKTKKPNPELLPGAEVNFQELPPLPRTRLSTLTCLPQEPKTSGESSASWSNERGPNGVGSRVDMIANKKYMSSGQDIC